MELRDAQLRAREDRKQSATPGVTFANDGFDVVTWGCGGVGADHHGTGGHYGGGDRGGGHSGGGHSDGGGAIPVAKVMAAVVMAVGEATDPPTFGGVVTGIVPSPWQTR